MEYAKSIERLRSIMDELREQCPWDKKQTIHTLRPQTIEEVYELTDAITNEDWQGLKEELGDMLLHIVFYSKIGAEKGEFTFVNVPLNTYAVIYDVGVKQVLLLNPADGIQIKIVVEAGKTNDLGELKYDELPK